MSNRIYALTVALEEDYDEDEVQEIINAIKMIKGVLDVSATVSNPDFYVMSERALKDLAGKFYKFIEQENAGEIL